MAGLFVQTSNMAVGLPPAGASPVPHAWGMTIATVYLLQLLVGVRPDVRYDQTVRRALLLAPVYPLAYWLPMSLRTVRSTLPNLVRRRPTVARWHSHRDHTDAPESTEPAYAKAS